MRWNELSEENCSMARTVSVIGDRWTLLILRDCFLGVRRFEDFQQRLGITRPILASRLKKLVDEFVLVKVPYQQRPTRYEYRLTPKGLDLYPIVMSIVHWGDVHMAGKKGRPLLGLSTIAAISWFLRQFLRVDPGGPPPPFCAKAGSPAFSIVRGAASAGPLYRASSNIRRSALDAFSRNNAKVLRDMLQRGSWYIVTGIAFLLWRFSRPG
jgi:DNA-binding HxlR family transcriptional regulator